MNRRHFLCTATAAALASVGFPGTSVLADVIKQSDWHCKWEKTWEPAPWWNTTTISLYKGDHRFFSYGKSLHINQYSAESEHEILEELFNGFKNMVNDLPYLTPADRVFLLNQAQEGMDDFYYE